MGDPQLQKQRVLSDNIIMGSIEISGSVRIDTVAQGDSMILQAIPGEVRLFSSTQQSSTVLYSTLGSSAMFNSAQQSERIEMSESHFIVIPDDRCEFLKVDKGTKWYCEAPITPYGISTVLKDVFGYTIAPQDIYGMTRRGLILFEYKRDPNSSSGKTKQFVEPEEAVRAIKEILGGSMGSQNRHRSWRIGK